MKIEQIKLNDISAKNKKSLKTIQIKKTNTRQTILGFGGAFTEASASIYDKLSKEKKKEIIQSYFSEKGNAYTMGRSHINSCFLVSGSMGFPCCP